MEIPIVRQCELLSISKSGYYYQPQVENPFNLHLMNLIDDQYTKMPFYGVEKMTAWLIREGYNVNVKRIRRLMRKMGLEAIYPKRRLKHTLHREQEVPILIKGSSGRISQSGMGSRHNLYTNDTGLSLPCGYNGLV